MGLKQAFGTNKDAIEKGAWIHICDNEDGTLCRLRIKRMDTKNTKFQKSIANHRKAFQSDQMSEARVTKMEASMIDVLVSTIITDWQNVEYWDNSMKGFPVNGETPQYVPFTPENVRKMLLDFPDILTLVTEQAQELSNFQIADDGEQVKN